MRGVDSILDELEQECDDARAAARRWKALAKRLRGERDQSRDDAWATLQEEVRFRSRALDAEDRVERLTALCWALLHGWMTERASYLAESASVDRYNEETIRHEAQTSGEAFRAWRIARRALTALTAPVADPAAAPGAAAKEGA
jgi:hypothetical protein